MEREPGSAGTSGGAGGGGRHRHPPRQPAPPAPGPSASRRSPIKGPAARLVQNMNESLTRPDRDDLPGAAGGAAGARPEGAQRRAQGRRPEREDLLHPPHRWAHRAGHEAAPGHGPHVSPSRTAQPVRVTPPGINLGLAVDVTRKDGSRGLVVPVIKGAEAMDFAGFHAHLRRPGGEGPHQQAACPTTSPAPRCRSPIPADSARAPRCRG